VNDRESGIVHRFYLTLNRFSLMGGKPIYFWDPQKGRSFLVFIRDEE
jgi:hypothetical protein